MTDTYVLTVASPDKAGLVAAASRFITENGGFITEAAFASDRPLGRFFGRLVFRPSENARGIDGFDDGFRSLAQNLGMDYAFHDLGRRQKVIILVSKFQHCLNDLLYRHRNGELNMDVTAVVSNHPEAGQLARSHGIRFVHLPVTPDSKLRQEKALWDLIGETGAELVVLARYMQVLSPELCAKLAGKAINIHHSFLPSFKGAKPYHQAFDRGVKLIGATAHYVTTDLDEGPIIEQETQRVDHLHGPEEFVAVGRDTENLVLSRAVRYHLDRRVLLNGSKTVVFR